MRIGQWFVLLFSAISAQAASGQLKSLLPIQQKIALALNPLGIVPAAVSALLLERIGH